MKKGLLFILFALFGVTFSYAQTLSIYYQGELLTNGQEVTISDELNEDPFHEMIAHAQVKNNTDRAVFAKVKRITYQAIEGTENQFCWSECYAPFIDVSPTALAIPENEMTSEGVFSGHYIPNVKPGTTIIGYTFFIEGDENDSVTFVVNFKVEAVGLADKKETISMSNAYPNPASSMVYFDINLGTDARLVIQNLLGQPLFEQPIEQGTRRLSIPLNELREGIYFYTLYVGNKSIVSKKLVIKR